MKIVYLERNSIGLDISVDCFRQFGDVTEYPYAADAAGTAERIADADIVLVNKAPMNAETLGGAAHVKLICEMATGYDNIDIDYCHAEALTKVGILGIKVWICRGEIYGDVDLAPNFAQEKSSGRSNGGNRGGDRKFRNKKK